MSLITSDKLELQRQNNCSIMLKIRGSIIDLIHNEFFAIIILHYLIVFLLEIHILKQSRYIVYLHKLANLANSFPAEIIILPFSFCTAEISAKKDAIFREGITFMEEFAFYVATNIPDKQTRKRMLDYANLMVATTFSKMVENIDLRALKIDPAVLDDLYGYRERTTRNARFYTEHYFLGQRILQAAPRNGSGEGERQALYAEVKKITEKCRFLLHNEYTRVSFIIFSTLIICCNIYIFSIFVKSVTLTSQGYYLMSMLELSIRFFIFYGWPKQYVKLYYPFGESEGRFDLARILDHNLSVSEAILAMDESNGAQNQFRDSTEYAATLI